MIYSSTSLCNPGNHSSLRYMTEDESIFAYGLELMEQGNITIQNLMQERIERSIISGIPLVESFDIVDIFERVITWFIDTIKSIFGKFKSWVLRVVSSENYIIRNKDRILGFTGSFDVDFQRYIYTCTDPDVPKCGLGDHFTTELDRLESKLKQLEGIKTKPERLEIMRRIGDEIMNEATEEYYGKARGSCLGLSYPIAEDNYAKELFNIYRNGGDHYVGKVNQIEVTQVYERYSKVRDTIKEVEKSKTEIIKSADRVKKHIKSINLKNVSKDYVPYDTSEEEAFDRIRRLKVGQIQKVCNIYVAAFSAKIDSLKESMSQDKRVLYEVITYLEVGE